MNQKKAKALRRAAGFVAGAEREYDTIVRKVDKDRNPTSIQIINERDGTRAKYQALKKAVK